MSDGAQRRTATSGQTRQRAKGAPRGGRHGLTRSATNVPDKSPVREATVAGTAARSRRRMAVPTTQAVVLTRAEEFAYIRSDMRRLIVIAGGLLALMVLLLVVVNR